MSIIRFSLACILVTCGLFCYIVSIIGVFQAKYILDRLHIAAVCDTLATACVFFGLLLILGISWASLKLLFILLCIWMTNPIATHFLARAELITSGKPPVNQEGDHSL